MRADRIPLLLVAISLAVVLLIPARPVAAQTAPTVLSNVTVSSQADAINIFVKTSREPKYRAELIDSPRRLIIDLEGTVYGWRRGPLAIGIDPLTLIRGGQYRKGVARVVFELTRDVGYAIREDDRGLAIVIPRSPIASQAMAISLRNVPWELAFQTVLDTRSLEKVEKDGVIRIMSRDQLLKERDSAAQIAAKSAEARLKESEALQKQLAFEAARREQLARGPLKEETIRLAYADPEEIEKTLQGILGITGGGAPPPGAPGGPPLIPAPPFSALYGTGPPPAPGAPPPPPPAEVLAKGITIKPPQPTNSIFIRHYEADLERIKKLIREKLDVPLPQVKIEARLNELNRADFFALGITWGAAAFGRMRGDALVGQGVSGRRDPATGLITPPSGGISPVPPPAGFDNSNLSLGSFLPVSALTGLPARGHIVNFPVSPGALGGTPAGIAFGIVGGKFNVNLVLDALESENKTTSLAKPEVVTVENSKAAISLGSEIPYATVSSAGTQVQFKEALLKLEVTPTVIWELGDITKVKLVVSVENNSRGADVNTTGGTVPSINRPTASTQVVVRQGETLAIGGIRQRDVSEVTQKVPFFGDIPVLGFLFRSKSTETNPNRELVVFITPYVLKVDVAQAPPVEPPKQ